MTDSEKLDLLMREREERLAADRALADSVPGPHRLATDPVPRPPFDWGPVLKALAQAAIVLITTVAAYYSASADRNAGTASSRAEAAAVQSKENAVRIEQTHAEVKDHGRRLDRVMGNVADRVPGKGN